MTGYLPPPLRLPRRPPAGALYPTRYLPPTMHRTPPEHWPALTRHLDDVAKTSPEVRARVCGELEYAVAVLGGDPGPRTSHTRSRSKRRRKGRR